MDLRNQSNTRSISLGLLAILWVSLLPHLNAQSTFGSIRGATQDPSGAVIAQAQVALHNIDENTDLTTISDNAGNYVFENVKPGHFRLTVSKDGFANAVVDNVELAARQDIRLDMKLTLAATSQQVDVQAGAVAVNTENATLTDSKVNTDITQLPINSRAVSSSPLAALAVSPSVTKDSQGNIAVGGATAAQTGFSVDGISTANVRFNGSLQDAYPSLEGIEEMKVTAFNNNAEFAQIGDVTFITKSGTNLLHGSLFEYFQNRDLDATILNFSSKAPKSFNTFGGSLGGPVTIPRLYNGRDKTFFFIDYEGNRKTQSYPEELLVPTVAERNGNLSDLVAATGQPLINPFTGAPFPNNTIPAGSCQFCINPVAKALLNYYPLPNANLGVVNPSYNYQTLVPIPSNSNGFDIRLDHVISSKQQVYARFSAKNAFYTEFNNAGVVTPANDFLPSDGANERDRSLVVSYNYSITPTLLNEFRFGFTNYDENDTFPISGASAISQLGLDFDHPIGIASHPTADAFPTFNFADGTITNIGQDRVGSTISSTSQLTDNLTKILGKHTLRFGLDVRKQRFNSLMYFAPSDDFGDFTFSGSLTNYSLGDFLLGLPDPSYFAVIGPQMNASSVHWGVYGQDEWQVNSHLTVNYGLRWELLPPFTETNGDIATYLTSGNNLTVVVPDKFNQFIANNPLLQQINQGFLQGFNACSLPDKTPLLPCSNVETASQAGLPQGLRDWNWHDFDPRVSIAWRPFNDSKTVIRAGFGIYTMTTLGPMSFNSGIIALSDLLTYNNSVTNGVAAFQFPETSPLGAPATLGGGDFEEANNPHWKDPSSAQWNLTVERELTPNTTLRLSYAGQGAYHLPITIDRNQIPASTTPYTIPNNGYSVVDPRAPFQNWLLLMESESIGNQNYQAGIVEFTHRVSRGLTFQGNYTWAKNISNAQGSDAPAVYASEEPYAVEIANAYDINYDRGNVVGMPRQRFLLTGSYLLPFGKGQAFQGNRYLNPVIGGWTFSTVTTIQTGQWLTPTMPPADDQSNTDMIERSTGGAIARPDCVSNPYLDQTSAQFYDPSAFALPPTNAGRFGSCGVGILQGPGMVDVDMGLAKRFNIGERFHVRFEATFTNVLNHTNFAPPAMNITSPSFGVLQSALPQGSGGNRTGQLALRVDF
jgi:Carboxypeptidase regulatory-like domain/TonB dependent receptor